MSEQENNYPLDDNPQAGNQYFNQFSILALSGGGYRGLFSARILESLEEQYGQLNSRFGLFAGTSIGSILAGALAVGVSAKDCVQGMKDHGEKIFPSKGIVGRTARGARQLFTKAPYESETLEAAIRAILKDKADLRLNEIETPLVIPCVSHTRADLKLLRSSGLDKESAAEVTLVDAMIASAAAPTYFPARKIGTEVVVDGGVVVNAPDMVALTDAMTLMSKELATIRLVSVGTASTSLNRASEDPSAGGIVGWMVARKLFQVGMAAQERAAVKQAEALLGTRYLRVDQLPSKAQGKRLDLDKADTKARETLEDLANEWLDNQFAQHEARLADWLR